MNKEQINNLLRNLLQSALFLKDEDENSKNFLESVLKEKDVPILMKNFIQSQIDNPGFIRNISYQLMKQYESNFVEFNKIENFDKLTMVITQKIHGTCAQILIKKTDLGEFIFKVGSKNRWLSEENDNYGFCAWCNKNKEILIEFLGEGRHYGEWCGPGINSGEGLKERTLVLFAWYNNTKEIPLPNIKFVPVLQERTYFSVLKISDVMYDLKENGSRLVEGYMNPEGVVIDIGGLKYKKVFTPEETKWKKAKSSEHKSKELIDIDHLLQPIRMQKVIAKDEANIRDYPNSIKKIIRDYIKDLEDENQIVYLDEDNKKLQLKSLGAKIFGLLKEVMDEILTDYKR